MAEQTLNGSCLCGLLQFSVSGTPAKFFHCHCSRCRKSSGTGHASNLFVEGGELNWTGDTDAIRSYKLPDAKRFSRTFCTRCGGPLPKAVPEFNLVMIPAGTLDNEPDISPQAHIFQDSKAGWSCTSSHIAAFPAYPK